MRALHDHEPSASAGGGAALRPFSVLLVEDDRGDAILVEELIADAEAEINVVWVASMEAAQQHLETSRPDCVLLDLNLPDAQGIKALDQIARRDVTMPIVVLTGLNDEHFGISAVAAGAQDYLVKGRVEPETLRRALLYAVERKRAELTSVELHASELRAMENARLERGLLPSPCFWTRPASTSSPSTGPAGSTRCSAVTSTTSCRRRTAPCTSWSATWPGTAPTRPRSGWR